MVFIKALGCKNFYECVVYSAFGCFLCFLLQYEYALPGPFSSAIVGFLASFIIPFLYDEHERLVACAYSGSFAAMMPFDRMSFFIEVTFLSFFVGAIYYFIQPYFRGYGGKLGTIAFVSSCILLMLKECL